VLDDIEIRRYKDMTKTLSDRIKVNFIYGPKTRILQDLTGKPDTVKFPIIAICPTGFARDDARLKTKNEDIVYKNEDGSYSNIRAVPFNLDVEINILAKYQQDVEQIIQNFAVFANPYLVYSLQEPVTKRELRVEAHWDGNISLDYPAVGGNFDNNLPYRVSATARFTIKTWLFRANLQPVKPICFIYDKIVITDLLSCDFFENASYTSNNTTETVSISGIPQLRYVDNYYFKTTDSPTIKVDGEGFERTSK
jgi:hypothetical protein